MHFLSIFAIILTTLAIQFEYVISNEQNDVIGSTTESEFKLQPRQIINPDDFENLKNGDECLLLEGPPQIFPYPLEVIRDVIVDKLKLPQLRNQILRAKRMNNGSILFDMGSNANLVQMEATKIFSKSKVFKIKNGGCNNFVETAIIPEIQ